jgi:hypothetical protein
MITYCGRLPAASSGDRFPYIDPRYARETIAAICSLGGALATAIIRQTGSQQEYRPASHEGTGTLTSAGGRFGFTSMASVT